MVLLSDETAKAEKPIHTFRDILHDRKRRELKKARKSAAFNFAKEFLFIAFLFGFLFFIVGGVSR